MRQIVFCFFAAMLGCNGSKKEPEVTKGDPLDTLKIDGSGSYLRKLRTKPDELRDFKKGFPAEEIDPKRHVPVEGVAKIRIKGEPILWFTSDYTAVVVDKRYFTDLKAGDATRLQPDRKETIGRFLDSSFATLSLREVVKLLLQAEVIRTYVHIEAEVRLTKETDDGKSYESFWDGTHVFYTNERNVADYKFKVTIDKRTGEILLEGR